MTASHFTVEVSVRETIPPQPIMNSNNYPVKSVGGADALSERRVIDRLKVIVSAEDEGDAIKRAILMLDSSLAS